MSSYPDIEPVTPLQVQQTIERAQRVAPLTLREDDYRKRYMREINTLLTSGSTYPFTWKLSDNEACAFDRRAFDATIEAYRARYTVTVASRPIHDKWATGTDYEVVITPKVTTV